MKNTASILLVDDDSAFRHVMAGELRRLGHDVATAASGEEAVAQVERQEPEIVLLDLRLPGMDGLAALKAIRARNPVDRGDHAHRPRLHRYRHRVHPRGRVRLRHQAVPAGRDPDPRAARHRAARAAAAGQPAGARPHAARPGSVVRRREPGVSPHAAPGGTGGAERFHRADHGRNRQRQGARGQAAPRAQPAQGQAVRGGGLRRAAGEPAAERVVRTRARRLHRRRQGQARPVRSGARRARSFWTRSARSARPRR